MYHLEGLRVPLLVRVPQFGNHCYKLQTYVRYRYQQPLSRCITCQDICVQQLHAAKRLHHRDLKCIFEDLLSCHCYATQANSTPIRSRVSQPASAGKEADLVNCKLITVCYQNSEPDSCSLQCGCHIGKQQSLQELNQLIRIKLLISRFPEIFAS